MFFSGIADEAADSIERQVLAHQALGWTHIEPRGINGTNLTTVDDATFDHVVGVLADAGMQVNCFASTVATGKRPITGDFALDVEELRRAIPRMQRLGVQYLRCMSWPNPGHALDEAAWGNEAIRRLRELAHMAEDGGVTLLHENCSGWGSLSPEHTLEMLGRVDSPALKLVFDPGNTMHADNALDYLCKIIDHVVHVHIKDGGWDPALDGKAHTYPGEGQCEIAACIRLLLDHGYDAGYSIEPHLAGVIHEAEGKARDFTVVRWETYLEYGRRFMRLYDGIRAAV